MTGPIRTVLFGLEAVAGTKAATMYNTYFIDEPEQVDEFARELIDVHNGTVEGAVLVALGPRRSKLTITVPLFYDTTPRLLVPFLGTPTTSDVSGDTAVKNHLFKRATATDHPTCSINVYDNVDWWQILGAYGNTLKLVGGNAKAPTLQMEFVGPAATHISAPSVGSITSAYNPASWRHFEGDVNGAIADVMGYNLNLDDQRNPRYTGRPGASARRYTRGKQMTAFDADFDYVAYSGSYRELFDTEQNLANTVLDYKSTVNLIGNGVAVYTISGSPTGGTYTISGYNPLTGATWTTAALAHNANAAAISTALDTATGTSGVVVATGTGPYTLTPSAAWAGLNIGPVTIAASLTGGTNPSISVEGPHYPNSTITIPNGIIGNTTTPTVDSEKTQHIEARGTYDNTLASAMSWRFRNLVAAYTPD